MTIENEVQASERFVPGTVPSARLRWSRIMRIVGTGSLLTAVLVGVVAYAQLIVSGRPNGRAMSDRFTLIVGDWFPTLWDIEFSAILVGVAASLAGTVIAAPRPARRGRWMRIVLISTLTLLIAPSAVVTATATGHPPFLTGLRYSVLPEHSDGGCRIVVREYSFLLAGSGWVGIVQPGSVVVDWVRDYRADDGHRPFSSGMYTLAWQHRTADLNLESTDANPVWWTIDGPLVCER